MIYVISDLHGIPFALFKKLLEKAKVNKNKDKLFILGDVIDRGSDGVKYLQWIIRNQDFVEFIIGNHESMLLSCDFLFDSKVRKHPEELFGYQLSCYRLWKSNGARETIASMKNLTEQENEVILDYLRKAPLYNIVKVNNKEYLLSHSGGSFETEAFDSMDEHDWLWSRPRSIEEKCKGKIIRVFGHTPVQYIDEQFSKPIITEKWIDIDVGCAFGQLPCLLRLDDLKVFTT